MWTITLRCDGCEEPLTPLDAPHRGSLAPTLRTLLRRADARGWEQVRSEGGGQRWFCPRCRAARGGRDGAAGPARAKV